MSKGRGRRANVPEVALVDAELTFTLEIERWLEKEEDEDTLPQREVVLLLDTYGPAKNRDHLPALLDVLALIRAELSPEGKEEEVKLQATPSSSESEKKRKRKISLDAEADEDATPEPAAAAVGEDKPAPKRLAKRTRRATAAVRSTTSS